MNAELRRELERLLSALCDGTLTESEHDRLDQLLGSDEACRQCYLEYMDMHTRLLVHPGLGGGAVPLPASVVMPPATPPVVMPRRTPVRMLRYIAVAAATLAASLLVQLWWWHPRDVEDNQRQPAAADAIKAPPVQSVATLMQTADCTWQHSGQPPRDGARLEPGKLQLQQGLARIRFDNGSELLVQGPAELRLDGTDAATLGRGKAVFRSEVMAAPFALHTPSATLVDLGSEYGIVVSPDGEELHVFDGHVQRVPRTDAPQADPEYLQAGQACRAGPASFTSQPAKCDPVQFVRHLAAPPAPDAAGGLLAYEGFDYTSADALTTGKANGGRGWASPWTVTIARPLEWGEQKRLPLNIAESLTRPDAPIPAEGGRFDHAGFGVYYRQLATPVRLNADGVYYLSCLFRRAGPVGHPFNLVALMLRPNENGVPTNAEDMHRANGREKDHRHRDHDARPNLTNRLMIGAGGANQMFTRLGPHCARASLPITSGVTYLLVAKVVASRSNADQVFVRVYGPREPIGTEEPACWTVVSPAFHSNLVFHFLGVHVNSKNRQMVDEIRLGTTWLSVTAPWRTGGTPPGNAKQGNA